MTTSAVGRTIAVLALVLSSASASAQISPGPLSRGHARLEGGAQCLRCHDRARGVDAGKCLGCHQPLAQRIAAGRGLHARPEYRDCKTCHVEHQGADVDLVWWGKQGRAGFDHALTGYRLQGRHASLSCERCHRSPSYLTARASCASCHQDEHRGQFAGRACSECHGQLDLEARGRLRSRGHALAADGEARGGRLRALPREAGERRLDAGPDVPGVPRGGGHATAPAATGTCTRDDWARAARAVTARRAGAPRRSGPASIIRARRGPSAAGTRR